MQADSMAEEHQCIRQVLRQHVTYKQWIIQFLA